MKKSVIYSLILVALTFIACDPIEDRDTMTGSVTADELEISAIPVIVDGINSNKVVLENHSPVLSNWNYGSGTTQNATDTVLMVITGTQTITFTGRTGNGTEVSKEFVVNVDSLAFDVPLQWTYLCGTGEKNWVWDESQGYIWGNGSYSDYAPAWWGRTLNDIEDEEAYEGWDANSYMTFSANGATFVKSTSNGSQVEIGTFSFDMSDSVYYNNELWSTGELTFKGTTILQGVSQNDDKKVVYDFYILTLTDDQMILAYKTESNTYEAWFWVFKPKE